MPAWDPKLAKAPDVGKETWDTNARLELEWHKHIAKRGAKNTQRNHRVYGGVFFRMFETPIIQLERADIENFIARIGTKCAKLMNGRDPQCLAGVPISGCPLVHGRDFGSCTKYQPIDPVSTWSYICTVNRIYEWLIEEQRITRNPCLPVMRDFASRNSALFDERRRKPRRRVLLVEDVRALVKGSPIHHAVPYLVMAKGFLRIHEVLKLSWHPDFCNLDEGWMDIPMDWELGNKRKGNKRIIIDSEALAWIRRYRIWWEDHVRRTDDGTPTTDRFLITTFGRPWGVAATHNFNTAIHANAIRLGLMTGNEKERRERVNSHCYRAFATTWARSHGIGDPDLQILRGDLAPGSIDRYDSYLRRLPALYAQYGPVIGV